MEIATWTSQRGRGEARLETFTRRFGERSPLALAWCLGPSRTLNYLIRPVNV